MNYFFFKSNRLRLFSAGLLLFVFTIGIAPRKILHDCFANHKDSTAKIPVGKTQQYTKAGFNCNCDNLVAESPFISSGSFYLTQIASFHSSFYLQPCLFISLSLNENNLRGPPSKI
jgi:hypothetical protein